MKDSTLNPDLSPAETEEYVEIARRLGLHKVAARLLGEDDEDEETETEFDDNGTRLPSMHSRSAVNETLRSMGVEWSD